MSAEKCTEATFRLVDIAGYAASTDMHGGPAAMGDLQYGRKTYWSCSLRCAKPFAQQPSSYIPSGRDPW
jgi:hypothetical protein